MGMKIIADLQKRLFILLLYVCADTTGTTTPENMVKLRSSLNHDDNYSFPGDTVRFTCKTTGSQVLEWHSVEYIGSGFLRLTTADEEGAQGLRQVNPNVMLVLVSAEVVGGIQILKSQLTITVTSDHPNPSITCGAHDSTNATISFIVLPKDEFVYMTLSKQSQSQVIYEQESLEVQQGEDVELTCTTKGSDVLAWEIPDCIHLDQLAFRLSSQPGVTVSYLDKFVTAKLTYVNETGRAVMQSTLIIKFFNQLTNVICHNVVHGANSSITLLESDKPSVEAHLVNNQVCIHDNVEIECTIRGSSNFYFIVNNSTINCSCDDSEICNNTFMMNGAQITLRVWWTGAAAHCSSSLRLSARDLQTEEMTCVNSDLKTEHNLSLVVSKDCLTDHPANTNANNSDVSIGSTTVVFNYYVLVAATTCILWCHF